MGYNVCEVMMNITSKVDDVGCAKAQPPVAHLSATYNPLAAYDRRRVRSLVVGTRPAHHTWGSNHDNFGKQLAPAAR